MNINQIVLEAMAGYRDLHQDEEFDTSQANFLVPFRRRNPENKIKAPEFAYQVVYNKTPPALSGQTHSDQKIWNDMLVDDHIPVEILEDLNSISGVEIRSICEGHNKDRIAYVIFRPLKNDETYIKRIVNKLQTCPNTFAGYDIGNGGKFRICAATKNWYNKEKSNKNWLEWWSSIANYIRSSLK